MALAKTAIVASSILCTACVAAAVALPTAGPLVKTVEGQAKLAGTYIDFAGQDAFSALPLYAILNDPESTPEDIAAAQQGLASISGIPLINLIQAGNRAGFYGLASTSALSAYDIYQNGNGIPAGMDGSIAAGSSDAFVPTDTNPGLAGLSGLSTLQAYQNSGNIADLAGIDAFSAIPAYQRLQANDRTAFYDLSSTSALQAFDKFNAGQGPAAFVPNADGSGGYAALSGLQSIQNYLNSNGDLSQLNGIDGFSSIKSDVVPDVTEDAVAQDSAPAPAARSFKLAAPEAKVAEAVTPAVVQEASPPAAVAAAPAAVVAAPVAPAPVTTNKQGEVRDSANFSPNAGQQYLFGSGRGHGPDSGISGWGNVANSLRGALGMGPDPSTQGGGDAGGTGDAGAK